MGCIIVLMGVSGSGKTTVGQALARRLDYPFYDGDDFHPPQNVAKMAAGQPLDDDDRAPWLARLHDLMAEHAAEDEPIVVACSALKKKYRRRLREDVPNVVFVYLRGSADVIRARLQSRDDHYMQPDMLDSQFEALEAPEPEEAIIVDVDGDVEALVDRIQSALKSESYQPATTAPCRSHHSAHTDST